MADDNAALSKVGSTKTDRDTLRNQPLGNPGGSLWLGLAIGALGGALFAFLKLPLAWMLGAMVFTTFASISGVQISLPHWLRTSMIAILGVMIGSAFSPDLIDQLDRWAVSIAGLLVYAILAGAMVLVYLRKVGGYDPVTAYFSSSPGGLNEMVIVGREMGGDDRIIALTQASRILLTVMTIPFMFRLLGDYDPPPGLLPRGASINLPMSEWLLLGGCAVIGPFLAKLIRLPAASLTGAMFLSATVHIAGWSEGSPPSILVALAQVVLGTGVGCRFSGTAVREVVRVVRLSLGSTTLLIASAVAAGLIMEQITGIPWYMLVLAYAPGGLAEMSLVALGIGQDIAFVATHHLFRISIVVILAPLAFRLMRRGL